MRPKGGLAWLLAFLKKRSGGTESDTDYNGVFSYAGEWHAFLIGIGAGIVAVYTNQPLVGVGVIGVALGVKGIGKLAGPLDGKNVVHEIKREPWYAIGGTLLGWTVAGVYTGAALVPF